MGLKGMFKQVSALRYLNSLRRAREVENRYRRVTQRYDAGSDPESFQTLFRTRWSDGNSSLDNPSRVVFCGTDEHQDYGGFIQAMGRVADVRVFRRSNGEYGQAVGAGARDTNFWELSHFLAVQEGRGWLPDILFMQSMGGRFRARDLLSIKEKYGFSVINIGMDERLAYVLGESEGLELGISGLNPVVDLALVTVPEAVRWYLCEGVPAKYFPLASDPESYFRIEGFPKSIDVGFVGSAYGQRIDLAKRITAAGYSFRAYGPGWDAGPLAPSEANEFYNSCRVVLGSANIGYSKTLMNPKLRDYEVLLTGTAYITNRTSELSESFVEGEEILLYRDVRDLADQLDHYLALPDALRDIGTRGRAEALASHTYDIRFGRLFRGLLAGNLEMKFD